MIYRNLKQEEIYVLEKNGCTADNWETIQVKDTFNPKTVHRVHFSGTVQLGVFEKRIEVEAGIEKQCGLYNSFIRDCTIEDNVYISDVKNLARYHIGEESVLENIGSLIVDGETSFGNGAQISVLNEGGGRELMMYDKLSAQTAYLMTTCRHDAEFIRKLQDIIRNYADSRKSSTGKIGKGVRIRHCVSIKNVWIESGTSVTGAYHLEEGTIAGSDADPAVIGEGVIARHFIIQSGSVVTGAALLTDTFVGQGVRIGRQFSAENSAFFANTEGFHSEVVSVFAGPYTVTHHRSTLLIAAMVSFYNAGSGSNQSNHLYKLGPVHQGILERGAKTGSLSYMLWPSVVGPFSVVLGKHYANFDASEFPFSYINEEDGKAVLTPAMNLFTVGTRRDSEKWPTRDRRKDPEKFDTLHFELFNPYTIGKVLNAIAVLKNLLEKSSKDQEYVFYKGLHIKRLLLKTCSKYYEMAVKIYMGSEVVKRISHIKENSSTDEIRDALKCDTSLYSDKWIDMAGMFLTKNMYDSMLESVKNGTIGTIEDIQTAFENADEQYTVASWAYCSNLIEQRYQISLSQITKEQLGTIITDWRDNSIKLNNMISKDTEKEFDANAMIGFGIDGGPEVRQKEFESIRGTVENNKFAIGLRKESEEIGNRAGALLKILKS